MLLRSNVASLILRFSSKKLTAKKRLLLDAIVREKALGYGLGWVFPDELDAIGLSESLRVATKRAVESIKTPYHEVIIDGTINFLSGTTKEKYVTVMPKADALVPSVSAASIIAKVARDNYMATQDAIYPGYGFSSHVGYGTAKHRAALQEGGVTPIHRKSFAPIAKMISSGMPVGDKIRSAASAAGQKKITKAAGNKSIGNRAEDTAALWLIDEGYEVLERNWRTKYCEIDIIARKKGIIYFVEVKYRSSSQQGGGVAAVTRSKLQQMKFGAEIYIAKTKSTASARLAVASVNSSHKVSYTVID